MLRKLLHLLSCFFLILFIFLVGIIPFRVLYILSDGLAWLLRKVFRYRYQVIEENISKAGMVQSPRHKEELMAAIYKNLSDVLLEGIKSFTMSQSPVVKRHKVVNPELTIPFHTRNQSIILVTGHIGNWEWGSLSAGLQTSYHILAFYKRLKNPYIDRFIRWSRSRFGTTLSSIKETTLSFERQKDTPTLFLMAADQNPKNVETAYWVDFLGRKTAFLHGPEKHAVNNQYPIVFADIRRVKRGYYEIELSMLAEKPGDLPQGETTRLYARRLERAIRANPSAWLWSHRRWKHQPPAGV